MPKGKPEVIKWTGKNLNEIKHLHKDVRHFPEGDMPHYRDYTQHPDNLHVDINGATQIMEIGDSLVRDADGNVSVKKSDNPVAPRALRPPPPSKGRTHHASAG